MIRGLQLSGSSVRCLSGEDVPALRRGEGDVWLDVEDPTPEDAEQLRALFGFHQLTLDDILNARIDVPKLDEYPDYLFLIAVGFMPGADSNPEAYELDLYLGRDFLVSVHRRGIDFVDRAFEHGRADPRVLERGVDSLAHRLVDNLVDGFQPPIEQMEERLDVLSPQILAGDDPATVEDLLEMRRSASRMRRTVMPQLELVNRIARNEYPDFVSGHLLMYFRDVYDHLAHEAEALEGVREACDAAMNIYVSAVNNRMNEVMKALAVVAVVFLPLTLLASLYGMNVPLPGEDSPASFGVILAIVVLLGGGLAYYFRRRGWF